MAYMAVCVIVPAYFANFSRQKLVVALASCGKGFGTFLFSPIIQNIEAYYGWRGLFIVIAGVALQFCSFGLLFRPVSNSTFKNREKLLLTWNFMKKPWILRNSYRVLAYSVRRLDYLWSSRGVFTNIGLSLF